MTTKLNKRERRASALLAHYATCERLGRALGMAQPDGKKISLALWKAEKAASRVSLAYCNGECGEDLFTEGKRAARSIVERALGKLPPGFFVNGDPRGYALKIDNDKPEGKALIEKVRLHTDWGGYGILSPEITGD